MSLRNTLRKNKEIRKIFGKRELIIIEKQLLGVQLKPSEKTRLSRDIRKKFEAIKALAPFSDEFELKHGAIAKEIIQNVIEIIKEHQWFWKVSEIILFGSKATKRFHLFSDIDIAVKFGDISEEDAFEFRKEILGKTSNKVDVQVYNTLEDKIKKEIDKYGRILFKRKN